MHARSLRLELWSFPSDAGPHVAAFAALEARPASGVRHPAPGTPCLLAWRGGEPVARLSYAMAADLHGAPGRTGVIGHYAALEQDAGVALLQRAQRLLVQAGAARVIGPMDGSTWGRYRLALPAAPGDPLGNPPPFFTEPQNPPLDFLHWVAAGFSAAAHYESRIVRDLGAVSPQAEALATRLAQAGVMVRPLDLARFDDELRVLFDFSAAAFADNLYYQPIEFAAFHATYAPMRPLLDPELVLLAHDRGGRLLGVMLGLPDVLSAASGRPARVVLKTLAVAPDVRGTGLGTHLTNEAQQAAHRRGYQAAVHALMHVDNASTHISRSRYPSALYRRYALYQWHL